MTKYTPEMNNSNNFKQPEALRLADVLDRWFDRTAIDDIYDAATELCRLHAVNQELLEALNRIDGIRNIQDAQVIARAAIAKATGGEA